MPSFGRPNATGRSSGKRTDKSGKAHRPPRDEPWVWLTRELVSSPAWRSRGVNCARLMDFLTVEHMNHAGTENGNLHATYDQLVEWGLTRSHIRSAVEEAEFLGLLRFKRGGRWASSNQPSTYRLTFLPDCDGNPPSNEWKRTTHEAIEARRQDRARLQKARRDRRQKQIPGSTSRTTVVRLSELRDGFHGESR